MQHINHHRTTSTFPGRLALCCLLGMFVGLAACTSGPLIQSDDPAFQRTLNDDEPLSRKVLGALKRNGETTSLNIRVQTKGDVVRLRGSVTTQALADTAESIAYGVDGVRFVDNGLWVR